MNSLLIELLLMLAPGVLSCLILSKLTHKSYAFGQFTACALAFDFVISLFSFAILILMGLSGDVLIAEVFSTLLTTLIYGIASLVAAVFFPFIVALFSSIKFRKQQ